MRETNIVQRLSSPKLCARRIQAALIRLEAEEDAGSEIYLGREEEDAIIAKVLSGAPSKTPIALHAVGYYGVGRKTFLRQNLHKLFPRRFETFSEITVSSNQGVEELYRQLHDLMETTSLETVIREIDAFSKMEISEQYRSIASMIASLLKQGEFLLIIDDGGVYTEEGDYQPHLKEVLDRTDGKGLPAVGFIQSRMMPMRFKDINKRSYHQYIPALQDESTRNIFGLILKQLGVDYTDEQVSLATEFLDGHPFNIRFAAAFSHNYGLDVLIADPSELIDWKRKRAEDFLTKMTFSIAEADIFVALSEYRYLAVEMLFSIIDHPMSEAAAAIRRLQEYSCVERREGYCHIAPPLRDAIRRDVRFDRPDEWKQSLGKKICDAIAEYQNDDDVSIAILDGGALAAARGHSAPPYLSALILPSHLLRIARDYYDAGKRSLCIEFCERAWSSKSRLPVEAQLELLRIWGLSTVRINDEEGYKRVLGYLALYGGKPANRITLFLEGFYFRVNKKLDEAEQKFLEAWRLSRNNQSLNRELASLLAKQRRYDEAERFAHGAYEQSPTNPYIIDVMVEVLIGKRQQGLTIGERELARIMGDLERYGDAPGSSFFLMRKAQSEIAGRKYRAALGTINRAVDRTPGLVGAYFVRVDARIALNDLVGADQDIAVIEGLLTNAGGFSEGDEARLHELQVSILIEKHLLGQAKDMVERSAWLSKKVSSRLLNQIARTIAHEPNTINTEMRNWASNRLKGKT